MSVVRSKRGKSKKPEFKVIIEASKLAAYTIRFCSNEKYFPKRFRWAITSKIVDESVNICTLVRKANTYKLNSDFINDRKKCQIKALACIDSLLTLMDIAYYTFNIKSEKIDKWIDEVEIVQSLIYGWIKSDDMKNNKG